MAAFKNIRIKMKGGKSRMQRVKVLASGKYQFVKNITKSLSRRKPRRKNNPKKRNVRRMGKRKRRGGGKSLQRTAFKLIRIGALVAPAAHVLVTHGSIEDKIDGLSIRYTGFSTKHGTFHPEFLAAGWGPFLASIMTTYGIPKIAGIIRRL